MLFVVFKNISTDPLDVPVLPSEMEEHNNFMANGTLPQICLILVLSDLLASAEAVLEQGLKRIAHPAL